VARWVAIGSIVAFLVGVGLLAKNQAYSAIEKKRSWLESEMAGAVEEELNIALEQPNYKEAAQKIVSKPALWQPLVSPPERKKAAPDLQKMLADVKLTTQRVGRPPSTRVKILTKANRNGLWISVGSIVNDCRVKQITDTGIVFSVVQDGVEYTHTLRF
jgi:hypothetical protein